MKKEFNIYRCLIDAIDKETYTMLVYCPNIPNKLRMPIPLYGTANALGLTAFPTKGQELWVLYDGADSLPLPLIPAYSSEDGYKTLRPSEPDFGDIFLIGWKSGVVLQKNSFYIFVQNEETEKNSYISLVDQGDKSKLKIQVDEISFSGENYEVNISTAQENNLKFKFLINEDLNLNYDKQNGLKLVLGETNIDIKDKNIRLTISDKEIDIDNDRIILTKGKNKIEINDSGLFFDAESINLTSNELNIDSRRININSNDIQVQTSSEKHESTNMNFSATNFDIDSSRINLNTSSTVLSGDLIISGLANIQQTLNAQNITQNGLNVALLNEIQQLVVQINASLQNLLSSLIAHVHLSDVPTLPTSPSVTPLVCPQVNMPTR